MDDKRLYRRYIKEGRSLEEISKDKEYMDKLSNITNEVEDIDNTSLYIRPNMIREELFPILDR